MLQELLIEEIKRIPDEKLAEVYDLIHYFRLGLAQETQAVENNISERTPGSLTRLGSLQGKNYNIPDDFNDPLDDLREYIK